MMWRQLSVTIVMVYSTKYFGFNNTHKRNWFLCRHIHTYNINLLTKHESSTFQGQRKHQN